MATTNITIRLDEALKEQAERLFSDIGITMTSALTVFLKAAVRKGKIPFELEGDPFYSTQNMDLLKERLALVGSKEHTVRKTMTELEAAAHE
jgi:DNA-damage-inducible protein J